MAAPLEWIQAARLRTLPLALACIALGTALAADAGYFDLKRLALAVLTTLLYQGLSNYANDYYDWKKGTDAHRTHKRDHYKGDYQARAKAVRESATHCWLCGEPAREGDPWQADHIYPGRSDSPLAPAHRSCNVRRRFMTGS